VSQCVAVCRSVSQCVAVRCSVLQCVAVRCNFCFSWDEYRDRIFWRWMPWQKHHPMRCDMCCTVLHCVAVCCTFSVKHHPTARASRCHNGSCILPSVLQYVAVVLQCGAVRCSVWQVCCGTSLLHSSESDQMIGKNASETEILEHIEQHIELPARPLD